MIIVHDPQPAGLQQHAGDHGRNWIWRCHIDLSTPNPATIERLLPLIEEYDATRLAPAAVRARRGSTAGCVRIVPPAIDPLSPKNMALLARGRRLRLRAVRDRHRPAADLPGLALRPLEGPDGRDRRLPRGHRGGARRAARAGRLDGDRRPRGLGVLPADLRYADGDPDIKILNNLNNVGAIEVNAFQSQSDVCMQKSIREGFGLTVTEALWKGRPTIGGDVGGIPLQIEDGVSGFLVDSPERVRAALRSRSSRTPSSASGSGGPARSTPASTSSRRACCATGSSCSPSSTPEPGSARVGWRDGRPASR